MRGRQILRRAWPWLGALLLLAISFRWLLDGRVQGARDLYAQFFPETFVLIERWKALELPLWLPHERLGQPFLALLYTQVFYLPRVITGLVFGHVVGPNVMHVFHCGWAFSGAYLALRSVGRSRVAAFIGAAAWGFSPFFVELSQNLAYASTAAWGGWTYWALEDLLRKRASPLATGPALWSVARLALILTCAFHAGAPEMWLWQGLLCLVAVGFSRQRARAMARLSTAFVWAGLGSAVVALPALELILEWTQPGEAAGGLLAWSMSWQQLISIAIPDADFPRAEPFFGADQRFFFTLLLGPTTVVLAVAGFTKRRLRPIAVLAIVCAVLALGSHFFLSPWLLSLPPFRFFRFPVKYAVGLLFALTILSGAGVDRLRALARRTWRWISLPTFSAATVGVLLGLFAMSRLGDELRQGFVQGTRWALLSGVVVAVALLLRPRAVLLAGWLMVELLVMPRRVWPPTPAARFLEPSPIAEVIRSERHGRVSIRVDVEDPGTPWSEPIDPDVEADRVVFDSRKRLSVLRYLEEDLRSTSGYGFRDPWRLRQAFQQGEGAFRLAGVTHFVRNAGTPLSFQGPIPSRTAIDDVWLWRWRWAPEFPEVEAFPRAWVVNRVETMSDEQAFDLLGRSPRPPDDFAPLDEDVGALELIDECESFALDETHGLTQLGARPEHVTLQVRACGRSVVVLGDAWYPGWRVRVDGVEAKPLRAWGFLRAVVVGPGKHVVEWSYEPTSFRLGAGLSGLAGLAFIAAAGWRRRRSSERRLSIA